MKTKLLAILVCAVAVIEIGCTAPQESITADVADTPAIQETVGIVPDNGTTVTPTDTSMNVQDESDHPTEETKPVVTADPSKTEAPQSTATPSQAPNRTETPKQSQQPQPTGTIAPKPSSTTSATATPRPTQRPTPKPTTPSATATPKPTGTPEPLIPPSTDNYTQADYDRIISEVVKYAESYKAKGFTFEWKEDLKFGWDVGYFGTPRVRYEGIDGTIDRLKYHVDKIVQTSTDPSNGLTTTYMTYKVVQIDLNGDVAFAVIYGG